MERNQRHELRAITDEVAGWVNQANALTSQRAKIEHAANDAVDALRRCVVHVQRDGALAWSVLPLREKDRSLLGDVARHKHLPGLSADNQRDFTRLTTEAATATHDVRSVVGARRFFSGSKKRDAGKNGADFLVEFREWGVRAGLPDRLARLDQHDESSKEIGTADALAEWVGLAPRLSDLGKNPEILAAAVLADLPDAIKTIERVLKQEKKFRADAVNAGNEVRRAETRKLLGEMPVERLKDATRDRLRIGPLTDAGIKTVLTVLDSGASIEHLPGIGATTATRMRGAAQTLWQTTYDEMPTRIDIKNRTAPTTELLRRLAAWDAMRKTKGAAADLARAEELSSLAHTLDRKVTHLAVFVAGNQPTSQLRDDVGTVVRRARALSGASGNQGSADPWEDFLARPADYFAMLAELGFITEDEQKTHGDLPDDIVEAVRTLELDTEYLSASLRGYQSFGARFALVQRKVIIGDEMGLGKTVEALAVLAHLRAKGSHHTIVICPAAVVTNWVREVRSKSALCPHRIHGPGRESAASNWVRNGGVAVTTFETLGWFEDQIWSVRDLVSRVGSDFLVGV